MTEHAEPQAIVAPYSMDAEQALLGALMADNGQIDRIGDMDPAAFFVDDHRRIFGAIRTQLALSKPADAVSVFESMGASADEVGGLGYLGELQSACVSPRSAQRYAEIVRDYAIRRQLMCVGDQVSWLARDRTITAAEAMDKAQALAMGVADQAAFGKSEPRRLQDVLGQYIDDLQGRYDREDAGSGISTGFVDIDRRIPGGMDEGWLVILAARPGMGKTSLALQFAMAFAEAGHPALVLSQEMPGMQIGERLLSAQSRVNSESMRTARLSDEDWQKVTFGLGRIHTAPVWIDEQPALRIEQVRTKCRQVKRSGGLRLVVIDYLQLMVGDGENRTREMTTITAGLKALAKELRVTIIALSQLNRQVENRPNKRPIMSDLRESGSIEQDADLILGLYRDDMYRDDSEFMGLAELLFLKHRSGKAGGFVPLAFRAECTRFENAAIDEWPKEEKPRVKRSRGFDDE